MIKPKHAVYLLLFFIILLCFVVYVAYIVSIRSEGSFSFEVLAENRTVEEAYFKLPINSEGPIYRIKDITVTVWAGNDLMETEPVISEEVNGYITGFYVPLGDKGTFLIEGHYVIEDLRIINYEDYPWRVIIDGQTTIMQVTETKSATNIFISLLKRNSVYLIPALSSSIVFIGGLTTYTWFREKHSQQKLQSLVISGECDWCTVCVKFLKVDPESPSGKQLPDNLTSKLLDMLAGVNKIWEKCSVKFIPCMRKGKIVAETINPDKEIDVLLEVGYIEPTPGKKITLKVFGRLNAKDVLRDGDGKGVVMEGGKVNVRVKQWLDARWERDISFGDRKHKAGDKAPLEIIMAVAKSIVDRIQRLIVSGENGSLRESKEFFELVHDLADGKEKVAERKMNVTKVLEALAKTYGHRDACIKVFILSKIK